MTERAWDSEDPETLLDEPELNLDSEVGKDGQPEPGDPGNQEVDPGGTSTEKDPGGEDDPDDGNGSDFPHEEASGTLMNAEEVSTQAMQLAHNLNNNFNFAKSRRKLAYEDFDAYTEKQLKIFEEYPSFPNEVFEAVLETLKLNRVIVVAGARGLGKGGFVKSVAARMLQEPPDEQQADGLKEVLATTTASKEIRIPLQNLSLFKDKKLHRRVVILEDAFDDQNEDLTHFLQRLDAALLAAVTERMKKIGSYLVLTTAPERLQTRMSPLVVTQLESPPHEVLLRALHRSARALEYDSAWAEGLEEFLQRDAETIVDQLRTVPRILRFVDEYLPRIIREELELPAALERMDDLEHWLLSELPEEDEDAWTFVLALILSTPEPTTDWIPWLPLHRMWQRVREVLGSALGWDAEEESRSAGSLLMDRRFLSRTRTIVRRFPFPVGECVRFEDPEISGRLWRALLGPGRRIFTLLVPSLRFLAEEADPGARRLAAQALGRAGAFDPRSLFFRQVYDWFESKEDRFEWSLGGLYCGVLTSDDGLYRAGALHQLRKNLQAGSERKVRRGIHVVAQLGARDLSFALNELRFVLTHHLETVVEEVQEINKALRCIKADLDQTGTSDRRTAEVLHRLLLERWASEHLKPIQVVVLDTVQYVLVGLCFGQDSLRVFQGLKPWMSSDQPGLPPLVALLALRRGGILEILERNRIVIQPEDESEAPWRCSRILASLHSEEDAIAFGEFLESLYEAAEALPIWFRSQLRRKLRALLKSWAKEADAEERLHENVIPLFAVLFNTSDLVLQEMVFDLLQTEAFRDDEGQLKPFAYAVLNAAPPQCSVV